jgi:hypothetical protein
MFVRVSIPSASVPDAEMGGSRWLKLCVPFQEHAIASSTAQSTAYPAISCWELTRFCVFHKGTLETPRSTEILTSVNEFNPLFCKALLVFCCAK